MIKIPNVYTVDDEKTAPEFANAFAEGCGGKILKDFEPGTPWAGFGSPQSWDGFVKTIKARETFYYGDHAYFGRGKFYRVTKNAMQHTGIGSPDFDRLKPFYEAAKPWKKDGRVIVVCPQSDGFHHRMGYQGDEWLQNVLRKLAMFSDRPVIVHGKRDKLPLAHYLTKAHALVCHTSNSAVEALMAGVPVFCTGDCPASHMGLSDPVNVERPYFPECRMEFAAPLAANQWTLDEIRNGDCWRVVQ